MENTLMEKNNDRKNFSVNEENISSFGFINWNFSADTITICPSLAKTLAFETIDETQSFDAYLNLIHPDDIIQIESKIKEIKQNKIPYIIMESRKMCRDGAWRWFSLHGKVTVFDPDGNPLHAIGMCIDISHAKENEKKFNQMRLLFSKVNSIKEYLKTDSSLHDIYMGIMQAFKELTYSSEATFVFSSITNINEFNVNNIILHDLNGCTIDNTTLTAKKLQLIERLLRTKKSFIQNEKTAALFGIYFDLPFSQQGLLIIEREEPFDDNLFSFLEPLIDATTHIISIKKLQTNSSELNNILSFFIEHELSPVAMFDTEMRHKFVNDAWKRSNKFVEPHQFIGKTHYEVYPNQPPLWREQHQRALSGEIVRWSPLKIDNYFDETIWYEGMMLPWHRSNGEIGGIIIYTTIVTERMEAENKLKITVENLSKSNQALDRFAYVCSHDLKEPLRSISNFIQLLFSRNSEQFDEESLIYMRHILKGVDRMSNLIRDILSYSEAAELEKSEKTPLNLNTIINEIKESFDYRLSEINGIINVETLPVILGVTTQINQLFTNLISNAIKFHSEKSLVINIFALDKGNVWEFHVCDNGIGVAQEYHESIFTMFKRLHSKNQYEGSGIGLATCKKIVNEHQGEIYVQSVPEGGSDFVFVLPKLK